MNEEVQINGVYKHFKGDCYIVESVALCSETLKPMVVFRALYGNGELFIRDLVSFLEPVDKEKYPNVNQQQRFELMSIRSVR